MPLHCFTGNLNLSLHCFSNCLTTVCAGAQADEPQRIWSVRGGIEYNAEIGLEKISLTPMAVKGNGDDVIFVGKSIELMTQ